MAKKKAVQQSNQRYFIVNPHGTVHEVTADHAENRLKQVGYRAATKEEVEQYIAQDGNQRHDEPIAKPFTSTPVAVDLSVFEQVVEE